MSTSQHDPKAATTERADGDPQPSQRGLTSDELQAEQAGDLPDREAMSVLSVGGLGIDAPPVDHLDEILNADATTDAVSDGLPSRIDLTYSDGYPFSDVSAPMEDGGPLTGQPVPQPLPDQPIGIPSTDVISDDTTLEA
jgi:hypothetical protein